MEWLDRFQQRLGSWYQQHFGVAEDSELAPKDVLRKITDAMEEFRSEGLDGRTYVPNKYILEIAVMNAEERAYLLSFLDEEELALALERYMAHKNYFTRGPLDFTIENLEAFPGEEKLYVRALFDKSDRRAVAPVAKSAPPPAPPIEELDPDDRIADLPTVEAMQGRDIEDDELATVHAGPTTWAALLMESADGRRSLASINKAIFCIGRSRHGGNDLVLSEDGQVSKRHVRIEREPDGGATLYDLASTNGTFVNGKLIPVNVALQNGDVIEIGQTRIQFQRESSSTLDRPSGPRPATAPVAPSPIQAALDEVEAAPSAPANRKVAKLVRASDGSEHILGSEALIGRSMTCDIVLSEATVSTQQARIQVGAGGRYSIQDLSGRGTTLVNGRPIRTGERLPINTSDRISLGGIAFVLTAE